MLVGPVVSCIRSQGDGVPMMEPHQLGPPPAQGLYDPRHEHDACGVGFVVDIKGRKSHAIVRQALKVLINLLHRGACGCEPNTGDGAGILLQMPDKFLRKVCAPLGLTLPAAPVCETTPTSSASSTSSASASRSRSTRWTSPRRSSCTCRASPRTRSSTRACS